ncbi:MAG TPA: hypothetical protein VHR88_00425 [Solirubrobacteraceae bacterium]|nr:hypothetical protein [Solirubrobacteraceae bacterium]
MPCRGPVGPERLRSQSIRARYTAGTIGSRTVPSYVDEPGVDASRNTETYASLTVEVDSRRWTGVPFTLRSGKALPEDGGEIAIFFRSLPQFLVDRWPGVEPNVLRIGLQDPYVRLAIAMTGSDLATQMHKMELRAAPPQRSPYANLVVEMLRSNPMLTIRGDEAEEAWRIVDPVLAAWSAGEVPMQEYPAGTQPPDTPA